MVGLNDSEVLVLERAALNIRKKILRMMKVGREGHIGGAMSCADILTALYFRIMRIDPKNPRWRERDRFVLSAGHKCMALYATLAERGFFDQSLLDTYNCLDCNLPGHPNMYKLPGIETSTGALGHGLSIAGGIALAAKMDRLDYGVYVVMGDGEVAEGSNWEAAAASSHYKLDNVLAIIDRNGLQICGKTTDVMNCEPLDKRWEAFGWSVREIDGHNMREIVKAAASIPFHRGKPSIIIANTIKGKSLKFAENQVGFHYWKAKDEEIAMAEKDLEEIGRRLGV